MNRLFSRHWILVLVMLCPMLLVSGYPVSAQETPEPVAMTFGPGTFDLLAATEGLSALASYQATLTLSFTGTNDGQPEAWSRTYVMLANQTPAARQLTIETADDPTARVFMLEADNTHYERHGEDVCTASVIDAGNTLAEIWEPAGFLLSVIGAEEAGSEAEAVNGIESNHYTFDERAHGATDLAESTGELWVAAEGGYLVRYLLETVADARFFGEGIEGTLTWDYQLMDVNQPLVIDVPEDCPLGIVEVPMLPDANDIVRLPGMTTYQTVNSLADAAAFYEEQLAASGAESSFDPVISDTFALLDFTDGDQSTTVVITLENGITSVTVSVTKGLPPQSAPDPVLIQVEGAPVEIPLLPDATDVFTIPEGTGYATQTSIEDIAAFYEENMLALGAQISSPLQVFLNVGMIEFALGGNRIAISVTVAEESSSVFIQIDAPDVPDTEVPVSTPVATESAPPETTIATEVPSTECTLALEAIPILPDASGLMSMQGVIFYSTTTSIADIATFYQEQLVALGAELSSPPMITDIMSSLAFSKGDQVIAVIVVPGGGINTVNITVQSMNPMAPTIPCETAVISP